MKLIERNLIMLSKFYNLIIISIILLSGHQVSNSVGISSYKDLVYLNNDYSDYFLSSELSRRYKRQSHEQFCEIPTESLHNKYKILAKSETSYKPGDQVETATTLEVNCDEGYSYISLIASKYSTCVNGKWNPSPTTCSRSCPPLISTGTTTVKCTYKDIPLGDCLNPVDETAAILSCAPFYEESNLARNPYRICKKGKWQSSIAECYPSCGMKTLKGTPNVVNGRKAIRGDYPWHVGVYNANKELICGGSIIGRKVILSAAHCFSDHNGNTYPPENYYVAAGKYYRQYNDDRDEFAQHSQVLAIHIPDQYKAINHFYANDIAVIALQDLFTFSQVVQPICIELNDQIQNFQLPSNATCIVTGWGHTTEGGQLSEVLNELEIPFVSYQTCYDGVPEHYRRFITTDKICAGYINHGRSVCGGDSGGALVFKSVAENRHYVVGIVSTSPTTVELVCDSNSYSLYTKVSLHTKFVGKYIQYYNTDQPVECNSQDDCANRESQDKNRCRFPNFPPNGKYIFFQQNNTYVSGDYVPKGSILTLSCDIGYEVNSSPPTQFYCVGNEQWMPKLGTCKKLEVKPAPCFVFGEEGDGICINIHSCKPIVNYLQTSPSVSEATALQKYHCGYEENIRKVCCYFNKTIEISTRTIKKLPLLPSDVSNHPNINLLPKECGVHSIQKRILNGQIANLFEFPWMALVLFGNPDDTSNFNCVGTIINDRYILTSATCTTPKSHQAELPMRVRVGDYNLRSDPDCDSEGDIISVCADPAQNIEVEEVISYSSHTYHDDIALLRLRTPIRFKSSVAPICLPITDESRVQIFTNFQLIITGWGKTTKDERSSYLMKAKIPVVSQMECNDLYKRVLINITTQQHLCAGSKGIDTCLHDSGAPLQGIMATNDDLQYVQYGITSLGAEPCGVTPSVYTRVDYFIHWILDNLKI